jgi:hypothetical protein
MNPSSPDPASSLAAATAGPIGARDGARPEEPVAPLYFERLAGPARAHPVAWWTSVAVALLVAAGLLWQGTDRARFVRLAVPVVVGLTSIPLVIRYCFDRVSAWHASQPAFLRVPPGDFGLWLAREHRLVTRSAVPTACGVGLMLIASAALPSLSAELPFMEKVAFGALTLLGAFFAGVGLYHVGAFGVVIWHLGDFGVSVDDHPFGVRSVGGLMGTTWSLAALVWCAFTSTAVTDTDVRVRAVLFLSLPSALVLITSFVVCQVPLHRRMNEHKEAEVQRLQQLLASLLAKGVEHLTPDEMARVRFIEERIALAAKLPEWPFSWSTLVRVSSLALSFFLPHVASFVVENEHVHGALASLFGSR